MGEKKRIPMELIQTVLLEETGGKVSQPATIHYSHFNVLLYNKLVLSFFFLAGSLYY